MSRITLTPAERAAALERYGYTPRESAFLVCAALQSGFFLRRQYCQFIQKEVGGTAAALIEKVITWGHATALEGSRQTQVYHLCSRPFYAALGEEDNRNRRLRPPVVIKNKLMCLDLVLDFPARSFLATEQEKVAHFVRALGINCQELPAKEFRSPTAVESTARYFVDKYPIALTSDGAVSFCFIDEGLATGARFESYLTQYAALFARLGRFDLIYGAGSDRPFAHARHLFSRFAGGSTSNKYVDPERLLTHFKDRAAYDAKALDSFDRARLIRMRDDRHAFSGRAIDVLYDAWKLGGDPALRTALAGQKPSPQTFNGSFKTHLFTHNYDVFGTTSRPYAKS